MNRWWKIGVALGVAVVAPGCLGMGTITIGLAEESSPTFVIEAVGLSGTTAEPCAVTVGQVDDQDGADDTAWHARFDLDGGTRATSLPEDDGSAVTHALKVAATRGSDGQTSYRDVRITFVE